MMPVPGVFISGVVVFLLVLWDAFEAIILPRRVTRKFRLTRIYFRFTWSSWKFYARLIPSRKSRESFLGFYGPISLLFLIGVWAIGLVLAFGMMQYGAGSAVNIAAPGAGSSLNTDFYLSGTTFFTLGLGDVAPHSSGQRIMAVFESGLGFGFLALVLSYLPVIYQAFSRREVNIVLLDARAGSPPTAAELLRRHGAEGIHGLQQLLHDWERWSAQILESHVSYPVVAYFRSQHNNESWLGALAAILDASSLLISGVDDACARQARLTFAMCRHTVVDLAQVFHRKPIALGNRLPDADQARLRALLAQAGIKLRDTPASREKLLHLREMYEPYLHALAAHLAIELPPFILAKEIADNWKTSAWGRISSPGGRVLSDAPIDDHSD
jgi:hypothetical protein